MNLTVSDISQAYPDLTPEEQQVLLNIRQRKEELLHEIYQLKEELSDVSTEIEAMDTEEGAKLKVDLNFEDIGVGGLCLGRMGNAIARCS